MADGSRLRTIRALTVTALVIAFAQIVFGAIVRITGSGLGCGEHWPDCYGSYTPMKHSVGLLIEISHRYGAAALSLAILTLFVFVWRDRDAARGRGGRNLLAPASAALALVIVAALFGAVTVKLGLATWVVVTHLAIAMSLLAVLVEVLVRAGGFGGTRLAEAGDYRRSRGSARVALILAFVTLLLGALTANTAGAPVACGGFPWCRTGMSGGTPFTIHITHRILAFLLFGHLIGVMMMTRKRHPGSRVARTATVAVFAIVIQLIIAAALVEMNLPLVLRSLHQAVGTLVWIAIAKLYSLTGAAIAANPSPAASARAPVRAAA